VRRRLPRAFRVDLGPVALWIFHELLSRDHADGCATWQPQGVGFEAYLNGTSQGPTPEDARKDGHIIRARCAPLSPASGFPVSWPQQVIHEISGLGQKAAPHQVRPERRHIWRFRV
jgi:hypothetical protein